TTITKDYRAQNVGAAYGPVQELGMGMVLKVDSAEVFQPIREQLAPVFGLLVILVAAGTLLLRSQVRPLARRLIDFSKHLEQRVAQRTADVNVALENLGKSERHYRALFDANPHPMWVYDVKTLKFLAINEATVVKYGYSR